MTKPKTPVAPVPPPPAIAGLPAFTPVPRITMRHDGWNPERQRAFIAALADTGNRVAPFWKKIWPKSRDLRSSKMSESLARLVIAADQAFPDALLAISDWLLPIEHPHYIIHLFDEQKLASRFPKETLEFLTLVNSDHAWPSEEMRTILDDIVATKPNLVTDGRFVQLDTRLRQANL